ncbi:MAG: hypothetical protein KBD55_03390 [Candidatus Pacebacteria bacterium]|nr:hypothetical protein [Candidatus Paceibacterota bacterium]
MTEKPTSNFEKSPIPKEREVMKLIESLIGERPYTEVIRREDEEGPYRLVIEVIGDDGDLVRYDFIRAGQFAEGNSSETAIDVIYLNSEGDEVGGSCAAKYVNGAWVRE